MTNALRQLLAINSTMFKGGGKMELHQLTRALADGADIRWSHDDYRVHWSNDAIRITYWPNGWGAVLHVSELAQCYVKGAAKCAPMGGI